MKTITDVIIVGAGVMGCSAAFHLARLGTRVIVVEKGSIASGMTKRSGGLVVTHYARDAEARLALASLRYFQDWGNMVGGNCGYTQTGFARVVSGDEQAAQLSERVSRLRSLGVNTQTLSPSELKELQPDIVTDDIALAAYEPEDGFVDSVEATHALAARAKALGVKFQTGTLVKSIRVQFGRIFGVETNAGPIEALCVVVMAGAWSDRLLKPLGIEIGLVTERAEVAFFDRPPEFKPGHLAFSDAVTGAYFRPHSYGLTLGGLNSPRAATPINPDTIDEIIDPRFVADVQARIAARLPGMAKARYIRGHAGFYDVTPDGHAVLDRAPDIRGLIIAAGFNGNGFALAPAVGACISELVTDGEVRHMDLTDFRLARFGNSGQNESERH